MTRTISSIKVQRKNANRVSIYLDGIYSFGLSKITAAWLKVGQKLEDSEIEKLLSDDEVEVAYQRALRFLSFKSRSNAEMQNKLRTLGFSEKIIEVVCGKLIEKGYVDDQIFAETWVENRNVFRPRSHRILRWELRNKKVAEQIIDSVLDVSEPEEVLVRMAAEKYARKLVGVEKKEIFYRKLISFLGRRGFSYQVALPAANEMWEANIQESTTNLIMENEVNNGD
ncbi:MAG: regulatory protein RecX [Anaerolineaceae bacterium]